MLEDAVQHKAVAAAWLQEFALALSDRNAPAAASLFHPEGWLRDVLVFSWNSRSLQGRPRIQGYLEDRLSKTVFDLDSFKIDESPGFAPSAFKLAEAYTGSEAAFTFQTPAIHGRGFVRLILEETEEVASTSRSWRALSVFITPGDLRGHEENTYELGIYGNHTLAWDEINAMRVAEVERDPLVLVIGAGQTGLQVAARFHQMNIETIVIERNERVGDNWRKRYPTLSLNTPRTHHTLLYAPYPKTWPIFTPRDKVAAWLEHYAVSQDLIVWTSSSLATGPKYDSTTRRWSVLIDRSGTPVLLSPAHIVLATGTLGDPYFPPTALVSLPSFKGTALHAAAYAGGAPFAGQRVLVVGAGTTAADLAQDLHARGARAVTLLQREATCVVSRKAADAEFAAWPEGVPAEVADFRVAAAPLGLLGKVARTESERARRRALDGEMWAALERRGFKIVDGSHGGGRRELVYERLGGYWIDVGAAQLIIDGYISVKSGTEIARFASNGHTVLFTDGSSLDVDAVIFATGYENIRPSMRKIFGADVIDATQEVWGLDAEGELRGCYRPSGHPGLWYAAGDFYHSRYMSKQLALLIKSEELRLTVFDNLASIPANAVVPPGQPHEESALKLEGAKARMEGTLRKAAL